VEVAALARAAGIGLGLGVLTGIPLGVVNVAVIEVAGRDRRRAAWLGAGGAIADAIHTAIAIVGYGAVITRSAVATRVLAGVSAAIVIGYAVYLFRGRQPGAGARDEERPTPASRLRALATGLSLTLPNPGALMAWTAVAAALFPRATVGEAIACAVAVGAGSAVWFAALARVAARTTIANKRWAARVVAIVLLALAAVAIVRTVVPA
jgi:threonine/homoserine/homoserine lactone efflux protein